jgi:hypothetical protein
MSAPVYLKLLHGRDDPAEEMRDWGFTGPTLGPFEAVHFTYATHVRCFPQGSDGDSEALELCYHDDMLVHDGKYYGDFEIATWFPGSEAATSPEVKALMDLVATHRMEIARLEQIVRLHRPKGGAP